VTKKPVWPGLNLSLTVYPQKEGFLVLHTNRITVAKRIEIRDMRVKQRTKSFWPDNQRERGLKH